MRVTMNAGERALLRWCHSGDDYKSDDYKSDDYKSDDYKMFT
jgi:hypothetical protein